MFLGKAADHDPNAFVPACLVLSYLVRNISLVLLNSMIHRLPPMCQGWISPSQFFKILLAYNTMTLVSFVVAFAGVE